MTSDGDDLPNPSRVVRYVPFGRMRKDENDNIIGGPNPNAFQQRDDEDYLSVTWCEYFDGAADEQLRCAIEAIRNSRSVGGLACYCLATTPEILDAVRDAGRNGRAVYYPEDDNAAHAGIHGISPDVTLLLEQLARDVWSNYLTKNAADALPISGCTKSTGVD